MKKSGGEQGGFFARNIIRAAASFLTKEVSCLDEPADDDNDLDNGNDL